MPELDELRRRATRIKNDSGFSERLIDSLIQSREEREPSPHVEEQIYDGFTSNDDQAVIDRFHELAWQDRTPLLESLSDGRLRSLAQRLIYTEAPDVMAPNVRREYEAAIARRLMAADGTVPWLTLSSAIAEIDELLAAAGGSEEALLTGHRDSLRGQADWAASRLALTAFSGRTWIGRLIARLSSAIPV